MKRYFLLTLMTLSVFAFAYLAIDKNAREAVSAAISFNKRASTSGEVYMKVSAVSFRIDPGMVLTMDTTSQGGTTLHNGYVREATSGTEAIVGFALSGCPSPDSNGDYSVLVDTSLDSVHYIISDTTGAVAQSLVGTLCDIASATQANPDASTHDLLQIVGVDPVEGTADSGAGILVKINPEEIQF